MIWCTLTNKNAYSTRNWVENTHFCCPPRDWLSWISQISLVILWSLPTLISSLKDNILKRSLTSSCCISIEGIVSCCNSVSGDNFEEQVPSRISSIGSLPAYTRRQWRSSSCKTRKEEEMHTFFSIILSSSERRMTQEYARRRRTTNKRTWNTKASQVKAIRSNRYPIISLMLFSHWCCIETNEGNLTKKKSLSDIYKYSNIHPWTLFVSHFGSVFGNFFPAASRLISSTSSSCSSSSISCVL